MVKYRVKAYFMHEHEQDAATKAVNESVITDAEWTSGYVMGVVNEADIKDLSKQGLVVSLVEEIASAEQFKSALESTPPGRFTVMAGGGFALNVPLAMSRGPKAGRPVPMAVEMQSARKKVLSQDTRRTQFYVVRFHGPITEERSKELRKIHVKPLERLTRNKYTVQLKPSQVKGLAEVPFVDTIRLYTAADTLCAHATSEVPPADSAAARSLEFAHDTKPAATGRSAIYAVKLHRAEDLSTVVKWLAGKKRKPLWKRGDQLQVALPENSKLLADLAKRPEVAIVERIEAPRLLDEPARTLLGLVRKNATIGLAGAGELIGVADTGIDETHADLKKGSRGSARGAAERRHRS